MNGTTASESAPRIRVIIVEGGRWTVAEQQGCFGGRSERSLLFSSEGFVRRVRNYPANWHELSAGELFEISWNR